MMPNTPDARHLTRIVDAALAEDIGQGDWTTDAVVPASLPGRGRIVAKESCVMAGVALLPLVWERLGEGPVTLRDAVADGERVDAGRVVARLDGGFGALLRGERVALNLLQRVAGIATRARAFADAVAGTKARVVDTRKTAPGLRALDKYGVRAGGAGNHRAALDGGILIKENHIAAAGSLAEAVARVRRRAPFSLRIEVETTTLAEVREALAVGADIIMLDNMDLATMRRAVEEVAGRALVEASGNVCLETVRAVAETGVDLISVGALTHSVRAADLSMRISPAPEGA